MALEQMGPFRLEKMLGRGGMGAVYIGRHQETGDRMAVKVLVPMLADDEPFRDRFKGEVEALKKLLHPNIVKLQGYGEDDGHLYYVMELVEGRSLQDELAAGRRFSWREVTRIGVEIARALKHAHDRGIVHRDLKPANLMLDATEQVKLTDFGIAKLYGGTSMTSDGSVMGTADYMAPEQAEGKNTTSRCDLYSLGSVLHALLAGRPPFAGRNLPEVLERLRKEPPIPIRRLAPDTPEELENIILQLLEKDPAKRIPTAVAVANRLKAMEHALSMETRPISIAKDGGGSGDSDGELRLAPLAKSPPTNSPIAPQQSPRSSMPPSAKTVVPQRPATVQNPASLAGSTSVPTGPMPTDGEADYRIAADGLAMTGVFAPGSGAMTRDMTAMELASSAGEMPTMITSGGNPSLQAPVASSPAANRAAAPSINPSAKTARGAAVSADEESLVPLDEEPKLQPAARATHFVTVTEAELRRGDKTEAAEDSMLLSGLKIGALLTLVIGVIAGGIYFATRQPTADQLAARIEAAAAEEDPLKLAEAENDLVSFLARFPADSRSERFAQFERDLELFRLQRRFELRARRPTSSEGLLPVERAYLEVVPILAADPPLAAEKLDAMLVIFDETAVKDLSLVESKRVEQCLELVKQQLAQLQKQNVAQSSSTRQLLKQKLDIAVKLESTDPAAARKVYQAIIDLYGDRAYAAEEVSVARTRRDQLQLPKSEAP